jgi:glycerophosphoryl diester phosphodiesterase
MNYWTQSNDNIFVAAHRGWKAQYPENTLEAFRAALTLDVDQLETDIRVTKDGELVLIHDATVDRTTNGSGAVEELTLAQLKTLDAGGGAKIPTLTEFMDLVKDHPTITLDIELKEYPTQGREELAYSVCDRVLKILDDYGFTDRCVINTWNGKLHEYIHDTYGSKYKQHLYYPQRLLGPCTGNPYLYGYCTCVFGIGKEITLEDARQLQKDTGVRLWAGTYAKDESSVELAIQMGAELITCDNPDEVLAILRKKNRHK